MLFSSVDWRAELIAMKFWKRDTSKADALARNVGFFRAAVFPYTRRNLSMPVHEAKINSLCAGAFSTGKEGSFGFEAFSDVNLNVACGGPQFLPNKIGANRFHRQVKTVFLFWTSF
jgi:hypothetical protein